MASQNIFIGSKIQKNSQVSRVRKNREYLISQTVAEDLNTYNNFGIFKSFNDLYEIDEKTGKPLNEKNGPGTPAVRSIFNRAGGVVIGTDKTKADNLTDKDIRTNASSWRISNNVPLMDSPENRRRIRKHSGCSVKELVQQSQQGLLGRAVYSYADFMYCKYLGKISNNYLITLRRFPIPPGDFISTAGTGSIQIIDGKNLGGQQIGCLVNWMGTPGNDMANILKYSYKMPYQDKKSEWNQTTSADSGTGVLNSIAAAFDPAYRQQYVSGHGGSAYNAYIGKMFGATTGPYQAGFIDQNKIYGPIDKVKSTMMRSDEGLEFEQNITLTFDYELRAYNGINTRQAMLDLISNILQVTYTTGGFWGGGYRGGGMHQNSIFNNLEIFKVKGGFTDFMDAFANDYSTLTSEARSKIEANGGILQTLKAALNALGGMILGGALNSLGRPQRAYANSLLSEQPVGMWHVMIGNPNHPIMSMGNMVLTQTEIQHYGPLGLDDFPTGIKVTCTLKRGKPRDIREIEKLYMSGNDRIYFSMGPKVIDMYRQAAEYQESKGKSVAIQKNTITNSNDSEEVPVGTGGEAPQSTPSSNSLDGGNPPAQETDMQYFKRTALTGLSESDLKKAQDYMKKWFGESDVYSIYFAASEQENGAGRKKEPKNNNGSKEKDKKKK